MRREGGVYELTTLGEAVWRVERYVTDRYMGCRSPIGNRVG
jgi:hypothetical protein